MRVVLFLLALAQAVASPATAGRIVGTVTADGAPVRHARVVAKAPSGRFAVTSTDGQGAFRFDGLEPGQYSVRAEKPGFVRPATFDAALNQTLTGAEVRPGAVVTLSIQLARAASIAGTIDITRGSPADKSAIYITADRQFVDRNGVAQTDTFIGKTDTSNHFRIANLPEGRYRVRTYLPDQSYWYAPGTLSVADAALFTLTPGQSVDIGELRWPSDLVGTAPTPPASPKRVIDGRIVDEFGDPAPWVQVQLLRARLVAGHRYLEPMSMVGGTMNFPVAQETDDLGRFRFEDVPPGDVYLVALPEPFGRPPRFADAIGLTGLQPAFYPGMERAADALPIRIDSDSVVSDITLALTPAVTGSLNIVNTDVQGQPYLRQVNLGNELMALNSLFQVQGGRLQPALRTPLVFAVQNLPVGDYMAWHNDELIPIAIAPGDVNHISLRDASSPANRLTSGVLRFDGPAPPLANIRVEFQAADPGFLLLSGGDVAPLVAEVAPNGRFTFRSWPRGRGVLRVTAPAGWALAHVTSARRDVTDTATDLAGVDDLTVDITQRVGQVVARVTEGGPPSAAHSVVLYAEAADLRTYPSRFVHVARVDELGNARISNVLPGRYLALTLPGTTASDVDLDWLEQMRSAATPVTVLAEAETRVVVPGPR